MEKQIKKVYIVSTKAAEGQDRTLIVRISTKNPDRSNDIVQPQGAIIDKYLANPVVGLGHNYSGLSIAKTTELTVNQDDILAKIVFPAKGVYDLADTVYELYKGGFMSAWSIGFMPTEWKDLGNGGREFIKWELLEFSAVLVPDNAEALTLLRSNAKDINLQPLVKAFEEKKIEKKEVKVEEKKEVAKKDVSEVTSLAYMVDNLNWMTSAFERNGVKEDVVSKMKEALALLMECLKEEAVLGEKSISNTIDNIEIDSKTGELKLSFDDKTVRTMKGSESLMKFLKELFEKKTETKEGRVLSDANRKLVSNAVTQTKEAVGALEELLKATEPKTAKEKELDNSLIEALKIADQVIGNALKSVKRV